MKHNLNLVEVILRMCVAMILVIVGWLLGTFALFPIGMLLVVTGLAGYCPMYHILGISRSKGHGSI